MRQSSEEELEASQAGGPVLDLRTGVLGVGPTTHRDAVERVRLAAEARRAAEAALDEAVVLARQCDATWVELGQALGMTRQGASRRYRHLRSENSKPT